MNMKNVAFAAAAVSLTGFVSAATVEDVSVRQMWPWSNEIKVSYTLSGASAEKPVDIRVKFYDGVEEIPASGHLYSQVSGDALLAVTDDGARSFRFDPSEVLSGSRDSYGDFRVTVTAEAATSTEVIYKIVDVDAVTVTDITRADILSGKYGDYETDYSKVGPGFSSPLEDVLVWTGVTNYPNTRRQNMVLRKIPAAGKHFNLGQTATAVGLDTWFTHDFWIGVFEVTQYQHKRFKGDTAYILGWETKDAEERASDYFNTNTGGSRYDSVRSYGSDTIAKDWPEGTIEGAWKNRSIGKLRQLFVNKFGADHEMKWIDLPTEAQWEFAARAGTTTAAIYTGKENTTANLAEIGRFLNINNTGTTGAYVKPPQDCDLGTGANIPGQYLPNAYGLYDMLGNVFEICLSRSGGQVGGEEPKGSTSGAQHITRGGSYDWSGPTYGTLTYRYQDIQTYGHSCGFRLCLQTHNY